MTDVYEIEEADILEDVEQDTAEMAAVAPEEELAESAITDLEAEEEYSEEEVVADSATTDLAPEEESPEALEEAYEELVGDGEEEDEFEELPSVFAELYAEEEGEEEEMADSAILEAEAYEATEEPDLEPMAESAITSKDAAEEHIAESDGQGEEEAEPLESAQETAVAESATTPSEGAEAESIGDEATEVEAAMAAALGERAKTRELPVVKPAEKAPAKKTDLKSRLKKHSKLLSVTLGVVYVAIMAAALWPDEKPAPVAELSGQDEFSSPKVRRRKQLTARQLRQRAEAASKRAQVAAAPSQQVARGPHAFLAPAAYQAVPGKLVRPGESAEIESPQGAPTEREVAEQYGGQAPANYGAAPQRRRGRPQGRGQPVLFWEEGDAVSYEAKRKAPEAASGDRELHAPLGARIRVKLISAVRSGQQQAVLAQVTRVFAPQGGVLLHVGDKLVGKVSGTFEERVELLFTKARTQQGDFKLVGWAQQRAQRGVGGKKIEIDTRDRVSSTAVSEGLNVVGETVAALTPAARLAKAGGQAVQRTIESVEDPEEKKPTAEIRVKRGTHFEVEISSE